MTTTYDPSEDAPVTPEHASAREAFAARLGEMSLAAIELQTVYLGERLGFYQSLHADGPATPVELAARTGTNARYAREWLEQQATASILDVDDADKPAMDRRFSLPTGHAEALIDPESPYLVGPVARFLVASAQRMPELLEAYRTGLGVDWARYGPDVIEAQEGLNRPQFQHFVADWIGALPDIEARLREGQGRVADVACGTGWSSIWIARHYPGIAVDGIDIDAGSIARATEHAAREGLADRVAFLHADAAGAEGKGRYDLVTIFEALHDMGRPVDVLRAARELLAPGGAVLIGDERVADAFAPGQDQDRMFYAYSTVACLPNGLFDTPSVGTGTVLRPAALGAMAHEAGFSRFTILPTEHEAFRFYRLDG
ncbi:MAG: class I SAM-dependent methyltransferase [Candidatus Limnocylindrales bacterium]